MKLAGQVALITGAGRNIGKAMAILFASEGAKIAVAEMHEGRGQAVVDEINKSGREAMLVLGGTVAGHVSTGERVGLLYFDLHADLNVPDTVARVRSIGWAWRKCWGSREPRASWSRSGRVRRC